MAERSLINSVLMTTNGPFFCQSTDATGLFKGADYLLADIKSAIRNVGAENVFIVALDGACKKTLRLIENDPTMHRIFPQRCTTHGCNLLIADIGKLFKWEISLCVRLVKFVCNHDSIFSILKAMPGSLQLLGAVETRFASQIYSSERILADKVFLKEMFYGTAIRDYMVCAPADQNAEYVALEEELISNVVAWERIRIFVAVEDPFRQLLRISDGHVPNLPMIAYELVRRCKVEVHNSSCGCRIQVSSSIPWTFYCSRSYCRQEEKGHCFNSLSGSCNGCSTFELLHGLGL